MEDLDHAVKSAHAALYRDGEARAFGGGFLIAADRVLTCAHVVNQVLGRPSFAQERPADPDGEIEGLSVTLPGSTGGRRVRARLDGWMPARRTDGTPAREGDIEWTGDLALLRLTGTAGPPNAGTPAVEPPDTGRCRVGSVTYVWFGSGAPSTIAAAVVQGVTDHWIVLDCPASAQGIVEGYSGSPVWDRDMQRVVGVVVSRRGQRAFAVPVPDARALLPEDAEDLSSASGGWKPDHRGSALTQQLLGPLRAFLTTGAGRAEFADRLARELGLPGRPPAADSSHEWIARTAVSFPRGIPTLLALLHADAVTEDDRRWVRLTALHTAADQFLTALEHRELLVLLTESGQASLPNPQETAARALPLGPALSGLDWADSISTLEAHHSHGGKVPRLLRVVEFAAAHAKDQEVKQALHAWNNALARRLGVIDRLQEHRAQALESTQAAAEAPLVQLQLWRTGDTGDFTFTLRATDALGAVMHQRIQDEPVPLTVLLAELRTLLEGIAAHSAPGSLPVIECFVTSDELDLPFDQWVYRDDDYFPAVLGQDFLCVLRCPGLRRPAFIPELRYRWQAMQSGRLVLLSRHDPEIQERGAASPVAAVALSCSAAELPRLRVIALAVGVPGVAWLRPTAKAEHDVGIAELAAGSAPHELPRRVYEARVRAQPDGVGTRLALVWDGPDNVPETLRLSDPLA
jgi:hypothetical protein